MAIGISTTQGFGWLDSAVASAHPPSQQGEQRSDERLMRDYRGGDADAFQVLYRRHSDRLHRFILRFAGAGHAEEIFQEVWIAVIRTRERYVHGAKFTTYLYAIAHRRAMDRLRAQGRAPTDGDVMLSDVPDDVGSTPTEWVWRAAAGAALLAAIDALPVVQREAFLLQAEGGLSLDEIAEATATGRETVKSRLRYANRRLREALEAWR